MKFNMATWALSITANGKSLPLEQVTPSSIAQHLYTVDLPDPDLIIQVGRFAFPDFSFGRALTASSISLMSTGRLSAR
jgi:hypothetical protein